MTLAASFSESVSPTVQVLKDITEKSNHPERTAMLPIAMIITPIHTESQSSVWKRFETFLFWFIFWFLLTRSISVLFHAIFLCVFPYEFRIIKVVDSHSFTYICKSPGCLCACNLATFAENLIHLR